MAWQIFDVPPPSFPCRYVVLILEQGPNNRMHAMFGGNTKPFQEAFVGAKIKLRTHQKENAPFPEYYRVLESMDLEDEGTCLTELGDVFSHVLYDSPVVIKVKANKIDPEKTLKIVKKLEEFVNVRRDM